jgi:hypothetical protein
MISIPHTSAFYRKSKSLNANFIHLQQSVELRRQAQILRRNNQ